MDDRESLLCAKYDKINRALAGRKINKEDREDLLHEIFIKAYLSLGKLKNVEKMDAWLRAIADNTVKTYFGAMQKERQWQTFVDEEQMEIRAAAASALEYEKMLKNLDCPADQEKLAGILKTMDGRTLLIFRLHYFLGYPLREIADREHMNYSTVKSIHIRGLQKLKSKWEEKERH